MIYKATIEIPKEELAIVNSYLLLTGNELYDKYGLKRDETITYVAKFSNGYEADIKVIICDGDSTPYIDPILFYENGSELTIAEPDCQPLDDHPFIFEVINDYNMIDNYEVVIKGI